MVNIRDVQSPVAVQPLIRRNTLKVGNGTAAIANAAIYATVRGPDAKEALRVSQELLKAAAKSSGLKRPSLVDCLIFVNKASDAAELRAALHGTVLTFINATSGESAVAMQCVAAPAHSLVSGKLRARLQLEILCTSMGFVANWPTVLML